MKILFVCLGNICRSPTAEALFRARCPEIACDSAGTGDWHVGAPPYAPMQAAARAHGLAMTDLRARQIRPDDFDRFDLILGMDAQNLRDIEALRPPGATTPVRGLGDYATPNIETVPDPYYTRDFDAAFDVIDSAITGLIDDLRRSYPSNT